MNIKKDFNYQQYSKHYKQYLESNTDGKIGGGSIKERTELLTKFLPAGRTVFEIGSGSGDEAKELVNKGYKVIASDYVDSFVEELYSKGLEAINFDAKHDLLDYEVDAVYANAVFVHFSKEELIEFLNRIKSSLRNEKIIFMTLIKGHGHERSARSRGFERDFYYYDLDLISKILIDSGYEVLYKNDDDPKWMQITATFVI